MIRKILSLLNKRYPRNFILRNPFWGSLIIMVFCFIFTILYKPLNAHESRFFNYTVTMAIYFFGSSVCVFALIKIIKVIPFYADKAEWTFLKEITAVLMVLFGMGITVYFMGFFMEVSINRWNLATFVDSCTAAFLIGVIPLAFFTLSNYRHLLVTEMTKDFEPDIDTSPVPGQEEKIQIVSRLKKEKVGFYPHEFIYAEFSGNYVVFYLAGESGARKAVIRNSISDIEQQLSVIPFFIRIHRAFIVNVKKILSKKGNTLGYRLKLSGTDSEIPVSRQKVHPFDELLSRYK